MKVQTKPHSKRATHASGDLTGTNKAGRANDSAKVGTGRAAIKTDHAKKLVLQSINANNGAANVVEHIRSERNKDPASSIDGAEAASLFEGSSTPKSQRGPDTAADITNRHASSEPRTPHRLEAANKRDAASGPGESVSVRLAMVEKQGAKPLVVEGCALAIAEDMNSDADIVGSASGRGGADSVGGVVATFGAPTANPTSAQAEGLAKGDVIRRKRRLERRSVVRPDAKAAALSNHRKKSPQPESAEGPRNRAKVVARPAQVDFTPKRAKVTSATPSSAAQKEGTLKKKSGPYWDANGKVVDGRTPKLSLEYYFARQNQAEFEMSMIRQTDDSPKVWLKAFRLACSPYYSAGLKEFHKVAKKNLKTVPDIVKNRIDAPDDFRIYDDAAVKVGQAITEKLLEAPVPEPAIMMLKDFFQALNNNKGFKNLKNPRGESLTDRALEKLIDDPSKIPEGSQLKAKFNALCGIFTFLGFNSALQESTKHTNFGSETEKAAAVRFAAHVGDYIKALFGLTKPDQANQRAVTEALKTEKGMEQKAAATRLMLRLYRAADG